MRKRCRGRAWRGASRRSTAAAVRVCIVAPLCIEALVIGVPVPMTVRLRPLRGRKGHAASGKVPVVCHVGCAARVMPLASASLACDSLVS